jgi:hypothetical protein
VANPARYANAGSLFSFWFSTFGNVDPAKTRGGQNAQAAAMVGREDVIVAERGENLGIKVCSTRPGDPVAEIARLAQATNIVIINEAHESPRDRQFIASVLGRLRPLGYSIYAAETLNNGEDLNHPLVYLDDGFYSAEPIFGRLLAEAKQLGYRLVGYEMTGAQGMGDSNQLPYRERVTRREIAQTENLMTAIFRDHPDAKVVIHVGHEHVRERAEEGGVEWLAQRLAAETGRDPLTISQTSCLSTSGATALAEGPDDGQDLYVAHQPLVLKDGRPAWRQEQGDIPTPVPTKLLPTTGAIVIEARPIGAPIDTVPADRLMLRPGEVLPLLLPPGRYRLDTATSEGPLASAPIVVNVGRQGAR